MVVRIDIPQIGRGVVEAPWYEEAFESLPHALYGTQGWTALRPPAESRSLRVPSGPLFLHQLGDVERRLVHILDFLGQSVLIVRNLLDAAKPVDYPLLKPLPLAFQDAKHTDQVAAPQNL